MSRSQLLVAASRRRAWCTTPAEGFALVDVGLVGACGGRSPLNALIPDISLALDDFGLFARGARRQTLRLDVANVTIILPPLLALGDFFRW